MREKINVPSPSMTQEIYWVFCKSFHFYWMQMPWFLGFLKNMSSYKQAALDKRACVQVNWQSLSLDKAILQDEGKYAKDIHTSTGLSLLKACKLALPIFSKSFYPNKKYCWTNW